MLARAAFAFALRRFNAPRDFTAEDLTPPAWPLTAVCPFAAAGMLSDDEPVIGDNAIVTDVNNNRRT